jgi:hypothetical protein
MNSENINIKEIQSSSGLKKPRNPLFPLFIWEELAIQVLIYRLKEDFGFKKQNVRPITDVAKVLQIAVKWKKRTNLR